MALYNSEMRVILPRLEVFRYSCLQTPSCQVLEATDESADGKTTDLRGLSEIMTPGLHCTSKYSARGQEGHNPKI